MQWLMGFLITDLLQIYKGIFLWKNGKSAKIWQNYGREFVA